MKTASVSETKNNLSALLDQVRQGRTILIVDRGRPIARLMPCSRGEPSDAEARLARLERAGAIRRGPCNFAAVLDESPPKAGASVLQALVEERRRGR
jgi:prevent-host-death family protein